jgi:hypothetical protein
MLKRDQIGPGCTAGLVIGTGRFCSAWGRWRRVAAECGDKADPAAYKPPGKYD